MAKKKLISVIIPVLNEQENVAMLHKIIKGVLDNMDYPFEIIFIDDGSTDNTLKELKKLKKVVIIRLRKRFGQSAAMLAGFKNAKGDIIISMDGDLQNDPRDIPKLVEHLEKTELDCVCGWRYKRKDPIEKKLFSLFANSFRNLLIKDPVHDSGCSLRAYKKECFVDFDLMGEMHRYIPSLLRWKGFAIGETKVNHFNRKYGKTKYGLYRVFKGFVDLFTVWFWRKFSSRPSHIFGMFAFLTMFFGFVTGSYALYLKVIKGASLSDTFLPVVSIFSVMLGVQFFVSGILADIGIKNYYRINGAKTYSIREVIRKK
jgi:glycosyltransferase involved in cell wall biosynthesis